MHILTPSKDRSLTQLEIRKDLDSGLDVMANRIAGGIQRRAGVLKELMASAEAIDRRSVQFKTISQRTLQNRLEEFREVFRRGRRSVEDAVPSAFAAIKEAASRKLGLDPYVVQLAGCVAMHRGYLAELATGEGKTLVAGMAAVLAGWRGRPCHIVTANDYLAQRDAEWMGPLYRYCGLDVGYVRGDSSREQRGEAYGKAVTYTTSKELVADFLRDRLILGKYQHYSSRAVLSLLRPGLMTRFPVVLRGLHTAIVDEADHILIDEAVTPVILSSPHENDEFKKACVDAVGLSDQLVKDVDFYIDVSFRSVELLPSGYEKIAGFAQSMPGLWRAKRRSAEIIVQALEARHLYELGKQYVIEDGKVVIVDEFTGRLMPQRTWREGLHQAVEVKENLEPSDLSETSMRLSFQKFFRFFRHMSGMTGTAKESSAEFWDIYGLPVVCIPTNRPLRREQLPARYFHEKAPKWQAVVEEIRRVNSEGRPVLVGVRTVAQSERLSAMLEKEALEHLVLNATKHREEAQIIAAAGHEGRITIATNMAGRGTDIVLGRGVADKGGLHVVATEFHEDSRIDRQLYGRSGRQGDSGSAVTFASLDDELAQRYIPKVVREKLKIMMLDGSPSAIRACGMLFWNAQRAARARAYKQRKQVLKTDRWLEESLSFSAGNAL
jgi:preprotein translocase subunit SecA